MCARVSARVWSVARVCVRVCECVARARSSLRLVRGLACGAVGACVVRVGIGACRVLFGA